MSLSEKPAIDSIPLPPGMNAVVVLIADQDKPGLQTLQQGLETGGYQVLATDSGAQALELLDELHPQIVLLGAALADMDGAYVCRQIKTRDTHGYTPVIILAPPRQVSGPPEPDYLADAIIYKPVQRADLLTWLWPLLRMKDQFDRLLSENQKLAAETRAVEILKSEIITNVSHELRTPLVQVKAAVSLLAEEMTQNGHRDQGANVADMAAQAVARLENAVENIRQLAQTHHIRRDTVHLEEAADLAIRHLERNWTSRSAAERVQKHLEADLPMVWGDKRALARLLQLLLDNALKFSPAGSPVFVLAEHRDDSMVWIGVQDFGIGIADEDQAHIFEAFYQVDGSTTRRYGGTGTGLALARLLADGMGASIQLDSKPNEGSTFSFFLPVASPNEMPPD